MNLVKLQVLVMIEQLKKVTDVAAALNLKQPTVTFHMKSLEDEIGVKLFESRLGRVILTDAGKSLYPYARKMSALFNEAIRTMDGYKTSTKTMYRVGAEEPYSMLILQGIRSLEDIYPQMRVDVTLLPENRLGEMFVDAEIDAVLMEYSKSVDYKGKFESLFEDEIVVLCDAHHVWGQRGYVPVDELAEEKFVHYLAVSKYLDFITTKTVEQPFGLSKKVTVTSLESAIHAVRLGMGYTLVSRQSLLSMAQEISEMTILPLPGELGVKPYTVGLLYTNNEPSVQMAKQLAFGIRSGVAGYNQ